jgi:FecR protein
MRLLIALLALESLVVATAASAAEPVGKTINVRPALEADGDAGNRALGKNSPIYFMDRLSTNSGGAGEFEFKDGTKLAISASARITVDESVVQGGSRFKKLGIKAATGSFRWISGKSASEAYQIETPTASMAIRGTAIDVTIRGGKTYVILLNGNAEFCSGGQCQQLRQSCDFLVNDGRSVTETQPLAEAFSNRQDAAEIFLYLANANRVSSRFRVRGGSCLNTIAAAPPRQQPNTEQRTQPSGETAPTPSPPPPPPPSPPSPPSPPTPPSNMGMGMGMSPTMGGN